MVTDAAERPIVRFDWDANGQLRFTDDRPLDDQAQTLLALAGFQCCHCHKPLRHADQYRCCDTIHCPLCGKHAFSCPHLIASREHGCYSLRGAGNRRFKPPVKSDGGLWQGETLTEAYGVYLPFAYRLFGPNFDTLPAPAEWHRLQVEIMQPQLRIRHRPNNANNLYWYHAAPDTARARLYTFYSAMVNAKTALEGTNKRKRLRPAMVESGSVSCESSQEIYE